LANGKHEALGTSRNEEKREEKREEWHGMGVGRVLQGRFYGKSGAAAVAGGRRSEGRWARMSL